MYPLDCFNADDLATMSFALVPMLAVLLSGVLILGICKSTNLCQQRVFQSTSKTIDAAVINDTSVTSSSNEDLSCGYAIDGNKNMKQQKYRQKRSQTPVEAAELCNSRKQTGLKIRQRDVRHLEGLRAKSTCSLPVSLSHYVNAANTQAGSSSYSSSNSSSPVAAHLQGVGAAASAICKRAPRKLRRKLSEDNLPLKQLLKMRFLESELVLLLRNYLVDQNLLRIYGFPVESAVHEGCVEIYKCLPKCCSETTYGTQIETNRNYNVSNIAQDMHTSYQTVQQFQLQTLLQQQAYYAFKFDSGQGSDCQTSTPSMDSDSSELVEDDVTPATSYHLAQNATCQMLSPYDYSQTAKQCVRCKSDFYVNAVGDYLHPEECFYHWGKLQQLYKPHAGYVHQYSCCGGDQACVGCTRHDLHVWAGAELGINGPYNDFVKTRERCNVNEIIRIYGLDCEMSFTGRGLELTKVTVVGYDGLKVYEKFVRPEVQIVDYNTRFSGVTARDLCKQTNDDVKTLAEVQCDLLKFIFADTILVGHNIDNDLRVLRIVHKTVIDTSIVFPHANGFPYRRSLKHLTKIHLHRDIQCSNGMGHSSFEDARASLELILWKMRKELHESNDMI